MSTEWTARSLDSAVRLHRTRLFQHRGVTAVGIGRRRREDVETDETCVTVFVARKRPEAYLSRREVIPSTLPVDGRGLPTDVVEAGPFYSDPVVTQSIDPVFGGVRSSDLRGGCEIGLDGTDAEGRAYVGTLGTIVIDRDDGAPLILSNNHVLVFGRGEVADLIRQPGRGVAVARLRRWVDFPQSSPLPLDGLTVRSDAAVAALEPGQDGSRAFMRDPDHPAMEPVSSDHPAVGLVFAGDPLGLISAFCQIEHVLDDLRVDLPTAGSSRLLMGPGDLGRAVEKTGRTTGYTSSVVGWINATIPVWMPGQGSTAPTWFTDVVLSPRLSRAGDSGSLVCLGGDGFTPAPTEVAFPPCAVMSSVGAMYDLPLEQDEGLADRIRDEFLLETLTGSLLVQVFYTNQYAIVDRSSASTATSNEKQYARLLYQRHKPRVIGALDHPSSAEFAFNGAQMNDLQQIVTGSRRHFTPEEFNAVQTLVDEIVRPAVGSTITQLIELLNSPAVFHRVYEVLDAVPTIELPGEWIVAPPDA